MSFIHYRKYATQCSAVKVHAKLSSTCHCQQSSSWKYVYTLGPYTVACTYTQFYYYPLYSVGKVFILLKTPQSPKALLFKRFWLLEHKWPMAFSDSIINTLEELGIAYETEPLIPGELDFTECFAEGFQKPHQKFVLDFLTHTKMAHYPPAVAQVCIDFLTSTAVGRPQKYIVPFSVAFIIF